MLLSDVITDEECRCLVARCEELHAEAGPARDAPVSITLPQGCELPQVPGSPTATGYAKASAQLQYRLSEAGFIVSGFGGNFTYSLTALCDPESRSIAQRVGERLQARTGLRFHYGQNAAMAPVNCYSASGGYIQPHRDGDLFGFGEFRTVATIALSAGAGGQLFVNAAAEEGTHKYNRDNEDQSRREAGEIPYRAAVLFDNDRVIHGTTPTSHGRRYLLCSIII